MQKIVDSKFPNFAKVAVAILESKLEDAIGKRTVEELRKPYDKHTVEVKLFQAAKIAEARFLDQYPDSMMTQALKEIHIADSPELQMAISNFYLLPAHPQIIQEVERQLEMILPMGKKKEIMRAAIDFLLFFREQAIDDKEFREKLESLAVFKIEGYTAESVAVLKSINKKLKLIANEEKISLPAFDEYKPYSALCSSNKPGLLIYLIDIGQNTSKRINKVSAIELINQTLKDVFMELLQRSMKGGDIINRYHIGCLAYGKEVHDIYGGIQPIEIIATRGYKELETVHEKGNTFDGLFHVWKMLKGEISKGYGDRPAPLICHITAGEYGGKDTEEIAQHIKELKVQDGNVLLENVLIDKESVLNRISGSKEWTGIYHEGELAKSYARQLYRMSSYLPETYRKSMLEMGYNLSPGTKMLYPVMTPEIISLAVADIPSSVATEVEQ